MEPVVSFPDPALVAEVAAIEAVQDRPVMTFQWVKAIAWALAFALAGGGVFATVAAATEAKFGLVSIVIGVFAGIGAVKGGRSQHAQIVGASTAAIGYFAGQLMAVAAIVGVSRFVKLPIDMIGNLMWLMLKRTFSSIDVLFLAIAVYEGWKIPRAR